VTILSVRLRSIEFQNPNTYSAAVKIKTKLKYHYQQTTLLDGYIYFIDNYVGILLHFNRR